MAKSIRVPKLGLHKATGQARVRFCGRDYFCGRWGTPEAERKYRQLVAEYVAANGATLPGAAPSDDPYPATVNEVVLGYVRHADAYYRRPNGRPTGEVEHVRTVAGLLVEHYGRERAADFGPKALARVRQAMIDKGWTRKS
ncbi:MAG: hypothetical protein ACFCVE_06200, partial [Phycisphaerae bacterium]